MSGGGVLRLQGAVVGHPVSHSFSPQLHEAAGEQLPGIAINFGRRDVQAQDFDTFFNSLRTNGLDYLSITMPHKQAAAALCDRLSPEAEAFGAANCVVRARPQALAGHGRQTPPSGELIGFNTDGTGFVRWLQTDHRVPIERLTALVLGTGGAGASVAAALTQHGANTLVANRTPIKAATAAEIANRLAGTSGGTCEAVSDAVSAAAEADLIVNATSLGMRADDPLPLPESVIRADHLVVDLTYNPAETPLMSVANARAAWTANGLGMLVYQAVEQLALAVGEASQRDAKPVADLRGIARVAMLGVFADDNPGQLAAGPPITHTGYRWQGAA